MHYNNCKECTFLIHVKFKYKGSETMFKKIVKEFRKLILYSLAASAVLITAYLIIIFMIQFYSIEASKYEIINNELLINEVEKSIISSKVSDLVSDVLFISDTINMNQNGDGNNTGVKEQWLAFAEHKKIYEKIRLIDPEGKELINIYYYGNQVELMPEDNEIDRITQECVDKALELKKGEVYITRLNTEMIEKEIEEYVEEDIGAIPEGKVERQVPALMVATPHYNQSHMLEGVIILNYSVQDLIEQVKNIGLTSCGNLYLLNLNDEYSDNVDIGNEARFKGKVIDTYEQEYADEWESMQKVEDAYMITEDGFFSWGNILTSEEFKKENPDNEVIFEDKEWYIVSHISTDSSEGQVFSINFWERIQYLFGYHKIDFIFIIFIAIIFGVQLTLSKIKKDKIKYFSEYDTLTDVYNRRAVFERLSKLYKDVDGEKEVFSICFIDINGLKEVNDNLGHDAGDELILTIVGCIKKNTRDTDLIARLGGDEFLIIFNNMEAVDAERVWMRISGEFDKINRSEDRKYVISASHGIEEFHIDSDVKIEEIINQADEKMYYEKRNMKNDIKVIREWPETNIATYHANE